MYKQLSVPRTIQATPSLANHAPCVVQSMLHRPFTLLPPPASSSQMPVSSMLEYIIVRVKLWYDWFVWTPSISYYPTLWKDREGIKMKLSSLSSVHHHSRQPSRHQSANDIVVIIHPWVQPTWSLSICSGCPWARACLCCPRAMPPPVQHQPPPASSSISTTLVPSLSSAAGVNVRSSTPSTYGYYGHRPHTHMAWIYDWR